MGRPDAGVTDVGEERPVAYVLVEFDNAYYFQYAVPLFVQA